MPSRLDYDQEISSCEEDKVSIDFPARSPMEIREEQLKDDDLRKIIHCFENDDKDVNHASWLERGYLMNQGVMYIYSHDSESEETQLVVPSHERDKILTEHHDSPNAAHYGSDGTYQRIAKHYFWIGMKKFIANYVKNSLDCALFKASNQKPAGLLQIPVQAQRFETIAIDLFGPLPESKDKKKWIFIVEDVATRWVELFALPNAIARECATVLMEEVLLRFGLHRRVISDNGTQFVSAVMQQLCYLLKIHQSFIPVYHPQANPIERKNRDLKPRLDSWCEKLPFIRFAMSTAKCSSTGQTAAFLTFGRELRTVDEVQNDLRSVILKKMHLYQK
ncbi:Pro-Pol polyprotein [Araneus ventricosus]|uniref:RNA-directed DNA polymerase n=1 Tax=Araneus ventricosus TaxID=182803 RepID=A0A4Y2CQ87_ARAVE|nr:Pro-Pol polyprotein [Araneus ventricosus]